MPSSRLSPLVRRPPRPLLFVLLLPLAGGLYILVEVFHPPEVGVGPASGSLGRDPVLGLVLAEVLALQSRVTLALGAASLLHYSGLGLFFCLAPLLFSELPLSFLFFPLALLFLGLDLHVGSLPGGFDVPFLLLFQPGLLFFVGL